MSKNIYVVGKVAFANLVEPKYFMDGSAKYSVRLLVDKFNEIKTLHIDIETFSDIDLKERGLYPYAQSPYFEIISFAVSVNGEPVKVYDLNSKELPNEIIQALFDDRVIKIAHNATFERICLSVWLKRHYDICFKEYGGEFLRP